MTGRVDIRWRIFEKIAKKSKCSHRNGIFPKMRQTIQNLPVVYFLKLKILREKKLSSFPKFLNIYLIDVFVSVPFSAFIFGSFIWVRQGSHHHPHQVHVMLALKVNHQLNIVGLQVYSLPNLISKAGNGFTKQEFHHQENNILCDILVQSFS